MCFNLQSFEKRLQLLRCQCVARAMSQHSLNSHNARVGGPGPEGGVADTDGDVPKGDPYEVGANLDAQFRCVVLRHVRVHRSAIQCNDNGVSIADMLPSTREPELRVARYEDPDGAGAHGAR